MCRLLNCAAKVRISEEKTKFYLDFLELFLHTSPIFQIYVPSNMFNSKLKRRTFLPAEVNIIYQHLGQP